MSDKLKKHGVATNGNDDNPHPKEELLCHLPKGFGAFFNVKKSNREALSSQTICANFGFGIVIKVVNGAKASQMKPFFVAGQAEGVPEISGTIPDDF